MINEEKYVQLNYINFNKKLRVCFNRMEWVTFLYSWKFLPNSARSYWLLRGYMTSYNETASPQNLWEGNIALYLSRQGGGGEEGGGITVHCSPRMLTDDSEI